MRLFIEIIAFWMRMDLCDDLVSLNWNNFYEDVRLDKKVNILNENILNTVNKHVPLRKISVHRSPALWITSEIRREMKRRGELYRLFLCTRVVSVYDEHKRQRNRIQTLIRGARVRYYNKRFGAISRPAQLWNELRRLGKLKSRLQPVS